MTPKEKAEQLTNKFLLSTPIPCDIEDAKICALIAANEVIKNTIITYEDCFNHDHWEGGYDTKASREAVAYWTEVKQEIEKL